MIQLAEYCAVITVSALATTLFLGGWRAPWPISVWSGADSGWWPVLWFLGKVVTFVFVFFWLRASLPRIRYDQLMKLGWKVLIPGGLAWTLVVATARVYRRQGGSAPVYIIAGLIVVVLLALLWRFEPSAERAERLAQEAADEREADGDEAPPAAPFPTPALDLPHYHGIGSASPGESILAAVTSDDTKEV
jgi:NADH-quinone oxidoreductase subunit H